MTDIEVRLRALTATAVLRNEDESSVAAVTLPGANAPHRAARWSLSAPLGALAATVLGVLLLNLTTAYYAPRYGRALAEAPGVGPISSRFLQAAGLSSGDVTEVGDSATSAGHKLKLVGAYADGIRTVLFVSIDGKGVNGNPKSYGTRPGEWGINFNDMSLRDQFGHSYGGWGTSGPTDPSFEALAWPASEVGARLTLNITGLWAIWKSIEQGPGVIDTERDTVHGSWILHVTLVSKKASRLPMPAEVRTDEAVYAFTGIVASDRTLIVHVAITGPIAREAPPLTPDGSLSIFQPRVYDAGGKEMQLQEYGVTWPKVPGGPMSAELTAFIHGPGLYRIVLADQDRWIDVP